MQVLSGMREDELGIYAAAEIVEHLLHLATDVREKGVPEAVYLDAYLGGGAQERVGARAGLALALVRRGEDDPGHLEVGQRTG